MKKTLLITVLIFSAQLAANQTQPRKVQTWAQNQEVYILHSHRVEGPQVIHSETTIISKDDGAEIFHETTAPFNIIIPVNNGSYFAGLSYFKTETISSEYNFALFTPDGRILSRVNVTPESGYCPDKYTQGDFYYWYSNIPEITFLPDAEQPTHIIVKSPNSRAEACELPF